jgi:hypothetical protein
MNDSDPFVFSNIHFSLPPLLFKCQVHKAKNLLFHVRESNEMFEYLYTKDIFSKWECNKEILGYENGMLLE